MTWFAWVRGLNGPKPQKVFPGQNGCAPSCDPFYRYRNDVLSEHKLRPIEENADFDELIRRYPPPKEACS